LFTIYKASKISLFDEHRHYATRCHWLRLPGNRL